MIKTIDMLLYEYRDYSNIYNKIVVVRTFFIKIDKSTNQ